jgi:hypothetical protein
MFFQDGKKLFANGTYSFKRLRFDVAGTSEARTHDLPDLSESTTTRLLQPVSEGMLFKRYVKY